MITILVGVAMLNLFLLGIVCGVASEMADHEVVRKEKSKLRELAMCLFIAGLVLCVFVPAAMEIFR